MDKTLADADYTELAEIIYGQPYSSDVARRMLYGSRRTLEEIADEKIRNADSSVIDELRAQKEEIQKERVKFYDQRREYNKMLRSDGRWEHLKEKLIEAARDTQGMFEEFSNASEDEATITGQNEAVLVLSDWHYGMVTDNIFNRYDTDICIKRLKSVIDKAIDKVRLHECGKIKLIILGDLIHGGIHTSARVMSEELVCEQIMNVSELLAICIDRLSKHAEVDVYMCYGNHARVIPNKKDNVHMDNFERIIPWWLSERFNNKLNVEIYNSDYEFLLFDSCGYNFCASHGDLDKVQGKSPKLLYTVLQKKRGIDLDYILLGDKHHREDFEEAGITSMMCGSLCGTDEYANTHRLYSEPSQLLLIVDPEVGVDAEYRLKCKNTR